MSPSAEASRGLPLEIPTPWEHLQQAQPSGAARPAPWKMLLK